MKPTLLTLGLASLLTSAPGLAYAQNGPFPAKSAPPELLAAAPAWAGDQQQYWGTIPPPKPLPYGYTWNDYRGAEIEHPLYAPRHHSHVHRPGGAPCLVTQFCCWFDRLFSRSCVSNQATPYEGHVSTELPPLPTLAPLPPPGSLPTPGMPLEKSFTEPAPIRVPSKPLVTTPAQPQIPSTPIQPAPLDPAPVLPPVDLIPTRPLVAQPAVEPVPSEATPIAPIPAVPSPAVPSPAVPSPAVPSPAVPSVAGPSVEDRQPLTSERPPVVELAPEFVVPQEPEITSPPQNVTPPAVVIPRNVIPQKPVPLNIVPAR